VATADVKVGSPSLVTTPGNAINDDSFNSIARSIVELHQTGINVVVVSSGAVALGRRRFGYLADKVAITSKQVLATIGQHPKFPFGQLHSGRSQHCAGKYW
jgi:glutamate 5-kinase